jgi:hypothetical protein
MSRPSFRARPIDVNQSLAIIREALDADQVVAREVTHGHQTLDAENEEVRRRPAPRDTSSMGVTLERAEPGTDRRSRPTRSKKPTLAVIKRGVEGGFRFRIFPIFFEAAARLTVVSSPPPSNRRRDRPVVSSVARRRFVARNAGAHETRGRQS